MKPFWKNLLIVLSLIIAITVFFFWQGFNNPNPDDYGKNIASSRMTYGRFLEYLDMGWIKRIDLYDDSHTAIVEAIGPELGNRIQRIRVELPLASSELIPRILKAGIDLDAHPTTENPPFWGMLNNSIIPILIIGSLISLFRRSNNMQGGPGQTFNFGKSKARFSMEVKTGITFNDVAGVDEAKEEFREIIAFLQSPEKFTDIGAKIPKGVMLVGPPGTGKTLLAKAIAGEANVPFFSISGSEFVEMFVGVGASRVRDLFKKAKENAPCIIFIDEIDAVGRQRGTGIGGGNDEREQTLNQILTEMDGFEGNTGVILIAATNRVDVLDSALLRPGRFDRQVTVNVPDIQGRIEILNVHSRNKKLSPEVSVELLARRTSGFSGADLANLLNEGAILAGRRKKDCITTSEIDAAIDRVIAGMENTSLIDTKIKQLVAYHEVGHAIVATLLPDHDHVQKVTLVPRGQAKGLTWFSPSEDQTMLSKSQIVARIMGALGGRAAEQVVFGQSEVTTGASNDLQQVTSIARQMVTRFGMSEIGPLALENEIADPFLGRTLGSSSEYSEGIASKIDIHVRSIVQYCHEEAVQIVKDNRIIMDELVDLLIDKETIKGEDLRKLISEYREIPNKK
jgi:cell division protease FtsH